MKTLGQFIVEKQAEYPNAKGELSGILSSLRLVAKIIHRDINKAGLTNNIIGNSGVENVQGETQMKLDLFAHNTMKQALITREEVAGFASEEEENFVAFDTERGRNAKYVILTDPLDGSSNIDVNVAVGTIFSIYRRVSPIGTPVTLEDFLQPGHKQVAAGYIVYGSSTMLVYTTGNGVNGFTYDPSLGVFCLSHENIQIPPNGKIYSINEGQYLKFPMGLKNILNIVKKKISLLTALTLHVISARLFLTFTAICLKAEFIFTRVQRLILKENYAYYMKVIRWLFLLNRQEGSQATAKIGF